MHVLNIHVLDCLHMQVLNTCFQHFPPILLNVNIVFLKIPTVHNRKRCYYSSNLCIIIIARAPHYKKKTKKTMKMDSFMDSKKANTWILPCINARTVDRVFEFEFYSKTALLSLAFSLNVWSLFSKTHVFADDVVIIFSINL